MVSSAALEWFGAPLGRTLGTYLFAHDPLGAARIDEVLQRVVVAGEDLAAALPAQIDRGGRRFELGHRLVREDGRVVLVVTTARDVTEKMKRAQREAEARELSQVLLHALRDREDFRRFVRECGGLVHRLGPSRCKRELRQLVVELAGRTGLYGMESVAAACHLVVGALDRGEPSTAELFVGVRSTWTAALGRVLAECNLDEESPLRVTHDEHRAVLDALNACDASSATISAVESWALAPSARTLSVLAEAARSTGARLGRPVEVEIVSNGVRIDRDASAALWSSLIHVVRNAVDHGIEESSLRLARGKPAVARMVLETAIEDGHLVIAVLDDGRGVDWDRVRIRATELGLRCETRDDLVAALFSDAFSTCEEVTEISGRGVGLATVREAVAALCGRFDIVSRAGSGTRFQAWIPIARQDRTLAVAPLARLTA